MTLLELCEPLFKKVCLLNRLGRKGASVSSGAIEYEKLRLDIKELFADIEKRAGAEPLLKAQWQKLELPLIFFVDSMIAESGLIVSARWHQNRLSYEGKELAGDEKFFDLVGETLKGPTGGYAGQTEYLRGKMLDISHRIRPAMDTDQATRICPEAYVGVDTRDLIPR